jgi:hypothetical protein
LSCEHQTAFGFVQAEAHDKGLVFKGVQDVMESWQRTTQMAIIQVPLGPGVRSTGCHLCQLCNCNSEEKGAAWTTLMFPFFTCDCEASCEQGCRSHVASGSEMKEQWTMLCDSREQVGATQCVECIAEIKL